MTKRYTVQQLASLSGVSVRTLHHYDRIGLLVPAFVGDNGYRYYFEPELLRLQQILFFREFGIALKDIGSLLVRSDRERIRALAEHRNRLQAEANRYRQLVETIDRTIASLSGERTMKHDELYQGFTEEQHRKHEAEAIERYGAEAVADSAKQFRGKSPQQQQAQMDELEELESAVAACLRSHKPTDDAVLGAVIGRHRARVAAMWGRPCPPQAYAGLADVYAESPEFRARFETIAPGLADYFAKAMKANADR